MPVTPGTRQVTVGVIAADIHGKNHHVAGSFCDHVESFRLVTGAGELIDVDPEHRPDVFWATAGGMGLTGVILDATIRCKAIESSWLSARHRPGLNLDELLAAMAEDDRYTYLVAWIDLVARGRRWGGGAGRGEFATAADVEGRKPRFDFRGGTIAGAPPMPNGLLNRASIRAFNELWFRKSPRQRRAELQTIGQFFHPLDLVRDWNRVYGPRGFLQWQYVVPMDRDECGRVRIGRALECRPGRLVPGGAEDVRSGQSRPSVVPLGRLDARARHAGNG